MWWKVSKHVWRNLPLQREGGSGGIGKKLWQIRQFLCFSHKSTIRRFCDVTEMKARQSEQRRGGITAWQGSSWGVGEVSAPGRAVIAGDTLIKMFWEGFQEVTVCGVQTVSSTQTHTEVSMSWLTRVNGGRGGETAPCPPAGLWQACLKSSKRDCFFCFGLCLLIAFLQHILLLLLSRPPFYEKANSISTWQTASHCLFLSRALRLKP